MLADMLDIDYADSLISLSNSILAMDFTIPNRGYSSLLVVRDSEYYPGMNIFSDGGLVRICQRAVVRLPNASPQIQTTDIWGTVSNPERVTEGASYWFTRLSESAGIAGDVVKAGTFAIQYPERRSSG